MQGVLVGILIFGALAFLGFRFYKTWFKKKNAGCDKCGTSTTVSEVENT